MLVKLTCSGHTFANAVRRARRAVAEFRIRGVATNIPFLAAVLDDPDFRAGRVTTSFIDERPYLLEGRRSADRGTRILTYLAETTVNRPNGPRPRGVEPVDKLPAANLHRPVVGRVAPAARRARSRRVRRPAARAGRPSPSPTPPSATRTSRCSPPGCAPGTWSPPRRTSPG